MAQLMLQLGLCERRGSGVDRAVEALEKMNLPAYKAESGDDFTRITLYPQKPMSDMTKEERIEACYQHCCLTYADNLTMNNQSLRERFGLNKNQGTIASHINQAAGVAVEAVDDVSVAALMGGIEAVVKHSDDRLVVGELAVVQS